jgi:hypothetical protein
MGTDARGASNAKAKRELDAALSELAPGLPGRLLGTPHRRWAEGCTSVLTMSRHVR